MRFLILSDMFSLESWLIDDQKPKSMPAVFNFFDYLGHSTHHAFDAIIFHPEINKTIQYPNGSSINIHRLSAPFHYVRKYVSFYKMQTLGQQYLEKTSYDLIYGMTIYSVAAGNLGRKNNLPSAGRIFGSLIWDEMQNGSKFILKTRYYFQVKEAKNPPDLLIVTEDGTEFDKALNHYNPDKKAHLLYNGMAVDLRKRLLEIPINEANLSKQINFISIGRLAQSKRHDLAIEVVDILKKKYNRSNIKLTILGKGEKKSFLEKLIKRKNLENCITIKAPINQSALPEILSKQHIGLFMYDASNLGNAIWETSLSGRLICCRPTGKTAAVFIDTKNAIVENEPSKIAERINNLDAQKIKELSHASRKLVDDLLPTWAERFDQEIKIIESRFQI